MRHEQSFTSISWIPSETIPGLGKALFSSGVAHYDSPPPIQIISVAGLHELGEHDGYRFVNYLRAWIEVENGQIVEHGFASESDAIMGTTTVRMGPVSVTLPAPSMPTVKNVEHHSPRRVVFKQTAGGRTAFPAPRRISRPPFFGFRAPLVWTSLELTMYSNGNVKTELRGASPFPRHWLYDHTGKLSHKVGQANYRRWFHRNTVHNSPWRGKDESQPITLAESDIERLLSLQIMHGMGKPKLKSLHAGDFIIHQGEKGDAVYLLIDGIVDVTVDSIKLGELGPGTIIGERSGLEEGIRTASIQCKTQVRVAEITHRVLNLQDLELLTTQHHREDELLD